MRPLPIILAIVFALGATEGLAYWWMHPVPAGLGQPVLAYRPQMGDRGSQIVDRGSRIVDRGSKIEDDAAIPSLDDPRSTIHDPPSSSYAPLPEVVAKSLPSLHCSSGTAARIDRDDGITIHHAFFEWDVANSDNVLEAFKHLPDVCMGSIGMTLVEHRAARLYQIEGEALSFDHTVFRNPAGMPVHTFKGIWVSGSKSLLNTDFRSTLGVRNLRLQAAIHRFRPAYSRVAQGAVRGIPNPDLAWQAFHDAMLVDLKFENR